ncbi:MAG: EAL domain-containing protein [Treponema sp.]|nr:EAL domain-containing protein [Treponema sp.]
MERIITFDICSVITLIILILSLFIRRMTRGTSNVIFFLLTLVVFLSGIFDIARLCLPKVLPHNANSQTLLYALNYAYYLFRNLSTPIYILFIFSICGMWHDFYNDMLLKATWAFPVVSILILIIADCFVHKLFEITPELEYVRGPWLSYMRIAAIWILAYSVICLIYNKNMLSKHKFYLLISLCPINVIGVLIQSYWPQYMVEIICTTFPLLFISLAVQKPEEIIDMNSGSLNMQAFKNELKRNFAAKRKSRLVSMQIMNFESIKNQFGKENLRAFLSYIIKSLYLICKNDEYEVYYLDDGTFTVLTLKDDAHENEEIARRIRNFMAGRHNINNINLMLDFKICYFRCPEDLKDFDSVINFERNMLHILTETNSLVYLEEISNSKDFQIHHQIDHIIQRGISNNSFEMYYQPIYDIEKKQFVSAEALIRLKDEELGFISPAVFIPAAEKTGTIHQIGDFVLEDVISFISKNSIDYYGLEYIELNLSVAQCIESNLSEKILKLLEKYTVSPDQINLEITETSQNVNFEIIEKNINSLAQNGISFSLDDYGTGYSNILRMTQLPLHIIKLDKSFVDDLERPGMKTIIKETIAMLKKMNKKILIEGVETYEDFDYFRTAGCDYVQGYYFSKPLNRDEFFRFLESTNDIVEVL